MTETDALRHSLFRGAAAFRSAFRDHVYVGPVRTVSRRLGVDGALRALDERVTERTPFAVPNGEITVGDRTCEFRIDSMRERTWFQKYPESDADMPVLAEIAEELRPEDHFWDVGGNVGIYSCVAATEIESGSVTAIEPHPKNAERIAANLRLNERSGTVYRLALAAEPGELEFYPSQLAVAGSYGSVYEENYGGEPIVVEAVPGDAFRAREDLPVPDVAKVDVEGAEYDVLRGLEETLSDGTCRRIYCNVCTEMNNDVADEEVYGLLERYGYDVEPIWEWPDGRGHYVRAER